MNILVQPSVAFPSGVIVIGRTRYRYWFKDSRVHLRLSQPEQSPRINDDANIVTLSNHGLSCDCRRFTRVGSCKHCVAVKHMLESKLI